MKRTQVEHVLRAAGAITDERRMVIVGSQAILGSLAEPPAELTVSLEADIYPEAAPEKADLIDGTIGEGSPFHETFGYYAHGVGPETAVLPRQWRQRASSLTNENTRGVEGIFPSPADLAVSKLAAGREKDIAFVRAMLIHGIVRPDDVEPLFAELDAHWRDVVGQYWSLCKSQA